ncbi:hypothetical protein PFISCL1PPCAC_28111, partial [Pristionchus fissidentatus]
KRFFSSQAPTPANENVRPPARRLSDDELRAQFAALEAQREEEEAAAREAALHKCDECEAKFKTMIYLLKHREKKHPDSKALCNCNRCGSSFEKNNDLLLHYTTCRKHKEKPTYKCKQCPSTFKTIGALDNHRRKH